MRTRTVLLGSLAFLLLWSGAAQACTTPNWVTAEGASMAPGETITVRGGGYAAGTVELRWGGLEGTLIAEPTAGPDGRFEAEVEIPADAVEGRKAITGVQPTPEGTRLWGFTEIAVEAAAAPAPPAEAVGVLALAALLLTWAAVGLVRRRGRLEDAPLVGELDADLAKLLEETPAREDTPV